MKEMFITGTSLPEAYHKALMALHLYGEIVPCPDYDTTTKECSMTMVVENPLQEPMISRLFIGGPADLEQYRQEMLDGILDFEVGTNWEYTYHSRMTSARTEKNGTVQYVDQIQFVIDELKTNPYSRRAVITVRDIAQDMGSKDPACLQMLQFFIRDNALHMKVEFRSNDAAKAAFENAFALIMLQQRIADALNVKVGTYTHRATSFHCYERDYKLLDGYIARIQSGENLTYNYAGDWDAQMYEARTEIHAKALSLRLKCGDRDYRDDGQNARLLRIGGNRYFIIHGKAGISVRNAFFEAYSAAKKDKIRNNIANIPAEYLESAGLTMQRLNGEVIVMKDKPIYGGLAEELGIELATCRHCYHREGTCCFRYGEISVDETACDHFLSSNGYILNACEENDHKQYIGQFVDFSHGNESFSDTDAEMIAAALADSYDEIREAVSNLPKGSKFQLSRTT